MSGYQVYLKFLTDSYEDNLTIGNGIHTVGIIDMKLLEEIVKKFMISDEFARKKLYNRVVKEEAVLEDFNNVDLFYYLDEQSFDFLDHIDTQEIIEHINSVGYYVTESSKY